MKVHFAAALVAPLLSLNACGTSGASDFEESGGTLVLVPDRLTLLGPGQGRTIHGFIDSADGLAPATLTGEVNSIILIEGSRAVALETGQTEVASGADPPQYAGALGVG